MEKNKSQGQSKLFHIGPVKALAQNPVIGSVGGRRCVKVLLLIVFSYYW